jgi:hypothetical protein
MSQYEMHLLLAISRGNFSTMISLELTIEEKNKGPQNKNPFHLFDNPISYCKILQKPKKN